MDNIKTQQNVKKRIHDDIKTQTNAIKLTKIANVYNCDLCKYNSKNKTDYTRHLLTKKHISNEPEIYNENINIEHFVCECSKAYKSRQGLYKHKKICNYINSNQYVTSTNNVEQTEDADKNTLLDILLKERQQFELERQHFKQEKEELQKQVEIEKQNVETEKLRNTINNDNLNIQINAFGCENLEHITDAFKVKCLKQIYKSIPEMVIKIHFNTKYPENHNVKIPNKKLQHASIMTKDKGWKTVDKKSTITSMVDKSFNLLDDTYEEHKNELTETKRKYYEKYQEKYWKNDKHLHKQLTNDVECLVLDGTR
jgi:hypothetical protein